jgi:UPF0716 family protein affecting phage T7 exclusion
VIWRCILLVPYVILAVVVAVAYGVQGFLTLMYFYFVAGAWLVFVFAWASLAQTAGRLNAERVAGRPLVIEAAHSLSGLEIRVPSGTTLGSAVPDRSRPSSPRRWSGAREPSP